MIIIIIIIIIVKKKSSRNFVIRTQNYEAYMKEGGDFK